MRCLYCDGKLPLYRKITHGGQFCSNAHRKAYWQEQERLAVERLRQTHHSLQTYRPAIPAEAILGPAPVEAIVGPAPAESNRLDSTHPAGFLQEPLASFSGVLPGLLVADPLAYESEPLPPVFPASASSPETSALGPAGAVALNVLSNAAPCSQDGQAIRGDLEPQDITISLVRPNVFLAICAAVPMGRMTRVPWKQQITSGLRVLTLFSDPIPSRPPAPTVHIALSPRSDVIERLLEDGIRRPERLLPLPHLELRSIKPVALALSSEPAAVALPRPSIPFERFDRPRRNAKQGLGGASLRLLAMPLVATLQGARRHNPIPEEIATPRKPAFRASMPPSRPALHLAKGGRYRVQSRHGAVRTPMVEAADGLLRPVLPGRNVSARPCVLARCDLGALRFSPKAAQSPFGPAIVPALAGIPQPLRTEPLKPALKLEPLNPMPDPRTFTVDEASTSTASVPGTDQPGGTVHLWSHAAAFLKHAPRDLKLLAFAIPALLALAFHPGLPKLRVASPTNSGNFSHSIESAVGVHLASLRQAVYNRAAIALDEDFRQGLDNWTNRGNAAAEWTFDETGFVHPGPLALYRPSMGLSDYEMQFLGMIDQKALSWVVRAADFDNFYVVKLEVLKPGPLPTIGVTRYAVIHGKAQNRVDVKVPIEARRDTLYRVRMDVHDDTFTLDVQDQIVDSWSEPRLRHGGIGFFSARGEESRVRWVQITHQYDMLGRLCAYLAPYDIPTTNGSLQ